MEDSILKTLETADLMPYAPVPFWSWNNYLEKEKLIAQIHHMKSVGCGGFIIHARTGLRTEYLSDEWFNLVGVCLEEAKKEGMYVWIYDENGWPSGFVGGKLLEKEENRACYLEKKDLDYKDPSAYAIFGVVGGKRCRILEGMRSDNGKYENIYVLRSPANTDILNPEVVTQFLDETHEKYYARFKESFGRELRGFFTDEPQYFRWSTPFAYTTEEYFRTNYGEDVRDGLISLFYNEEEDYPFRAKYYKAMNDLYTHNYYKRLYDWCDEHNCMLTGHCVEETNIFTQMWGNADNSPSYEFEHIPGIDNLCKNGSAMISARQVGSVAGQLGKKQILTETFGCCGYDTTPKETLAIAEKQYVHGVNYLCQHLYAYSLAGQGKVDHPPIFSYHIKWQDAFKDMNEYLTKMGYLLANSETVVNCGVINPVASVHLNYFREKEKPSLIIDKELYKLQLKLNKMGILYDFVNETILSRHGKAENGSLIVGKRKYDYLIVPYLLTLSKNTKKELEQFVKDGGKVFVVKTPEYTEGVRDDWSFLKSNCTLKDIAKAGRVQLTTNNGKCEYTYRKGEDFEFLYIVNTDVKDCKVKGPKGYSRLNLVNNLIYDFPDNFTIRAGESVMLIPTEKGHPEFTVFEKEKDIGKLECIAMGDNCLTMDNVQISFDGYNYGPVEPLAKEFERLLRMEYCGQIYVKYSFNVDGYRGKMRLVREKNNYLLSTVNGKKIEFEESSFDFNFEEADIADKIVDGKNEYVAEVDFYERPHVFWALFDKKATESVRNCLWYDTEIENVYLFGNFKVEKDRTLTACELPKYSWNLQKKGYPHFSGKVSFKKEIYAESDRAMLHFYGRFMSINVDVNGKFAGRSALRHRLEIPLEKGKINLIEVTAAASLRNTFGPFHYSEGETLGVGPFSFTLRGSWKKGKNGKSKYYRKNYSVRPFGIKKIGYSFPKEDK